MRVAIFVAVVAAHLALLWLFTSFHRWVLPPAADEAAITPIFLPPLPPETVAEPIWEPPDPTQRPAQQESERDPTRARLAMTDARGGPAPVAAARARETPIPPENSRPEVNPAPQSNSALQANSTPEANTTLQASPALQANTPLEASTEPGSTQPSNQSSVALDWRAAAAATAQTDAQHIVEAEDDAARKAAALTSHFKPLPGPRVAGPQFAWDYAHTHRITPLPGGGLVIALNDRCSIAILPLPMIGCAMGRKSAPNGDLFKNMHPPVKFGDWDWRLEDP